MPLSKKSPSRKSSVTIAVAMIARNEARCITRCLESVRPFVDTMVVLDTGSTDDTRELARKAGAIVHEMDWPGSFAEARNRSLDLADADWNLIIDADEWIESGGELLRPWCETSDRLGNVCVRSSVMLARGKYGEEVPTEARSWLTRVLPRGARFERRVHEQVVSDLPRERIEIHLEHDGYLEAQMATKNGRNRALLLLDLEDRPGDPYILYQLAKENEKLDEFINACGLYEQSLAATPPRANWMHPMVIRYIYCLGKVGEFDMALNYIHENVGKWSHSPDFFFAAGNIALAKAKADPANALNEWLPLAVSAWETCLEIGDRPTLEESYQGVGSLLAQTNLDVVREVLRASGYTDAA
ncbi:MAG: glycosyltransferase family 2 protein [Erythrobacter sp.]